MKTLLASIRAFLERRRWRKAQRHRLRQDWLRIYAQAQQDRTPR